MQKASQITPYVCPCRSSVAGQQAQVAEGTRKPNLTMAGPSQALGTLIVLLNLQIRRVHGLTATDSPVTEQDRMGEV